MLPSQREREEAEGTTASPQGRPQGLASTTESLQGRKTTSSIWLWTYRRLQPVRCDMSRVTTHWHLGDTPGRKKRNRSIFHSQYHFRWHRCSWSILSSGTKLPPSQPCLSSGSSSTNPCLQALGLAGHKFSMSTKDRHGAALCFSRITIKHGFHIRPPRGSKGKAYLPVCYSNFGEFPPLLATKNGLLMPEPMLTKARWNKKSPSSSVPASHFQPALSPIQDFIRNFPRVSGCPSKGIVVLCQPGTPLGLSRATTAQDGTLSPSCGWQACCGFEVATSWALGPGKAGECLQHPPYSSIPALAFCSQGLVEAVNPRSIGSPSFPAP